MNIIFILAPLSLALASLFVVLVLRSVRSGPFQELETPAHRMLIESSPIESEESSRVENQE